MTALRAGVASDPGRVRSVNEDSALIEHPIFAVADGMGGHRAGDVASQVALDALRRAVGEPTTEALVDAVRRANDAVVERASGAAELRGMGTTLCVVALVDDHDGDGERIAVANVGDSRAYLYRDGELEQLTHDHTLVQTMVDDARITPEEAAVHPQRHIVTRALGIDTRIEVDTWEIVPFAGDRFLVCSDGLFNEVEDDRIAAVLRRLADPSDAAAELVRLANDGGGRDNITCVVVDVVDDGDRATAASAALAGEALTSQGDRREPDVAGFTSAAPAAPAGETGSDGGGAAPRDDDTVMVQTIPPAAARSAAAVAVARRHAPASALPRSERVRRRDLRPTRPHRRFTWRVALFMVLLLAVVGSAAGAVWWYGRNTYYVGFDGDEVAVFRGRPGGFLWFDPTLVERTGIEREEVPESLAGRLADGVDHGTEQGARSYVANLEDQIDGLDGDSATGASSTTSP